jgi:hypothetical protein
MKYHNSQLDVIRRVNNLDKKALKDVFRDIQNTAIALYWS